MAKHVRGGPEISSDEMWTLIKAEFEVGSWSILSRDWVSLLISLTSGETFGYGRDDTLIRKGEQRSTGSKVCFKVIPTRSLQRSSDALREAYMLAAAKHKNVLESLGCFQSRSEVVIVTELCETDLLDKVLSPHERYADSPISLTPRVDLASLMHVYYFETW